MNPDWIKEAIAVALAAVAGAWAVFSRATKAHDDLERRIDHLERDSVTREELTRAIKDIEDKNERFYQRMDIKIDSIKSDMMWIMQAMGKSND